RPDAPVRVQVDPEAPPPVTVDPVPSVPLPLGEEGRASPEEGGVQGRDAHLHPSVPTPVVVQGEIPVPVSAERDAFSSEGPAGPGVGVHLPAPEPPARLGLPVSQIADLADHVRPGHESKVVDLEPRGAELGEGAEAPGATSDLPELQASRPPG